jgi:hypothetical protein
MEIKVRYDHFGYGMPLAITIDGYDVLHVKESTRNLATLDAVVRALQLAPRSALEEILDRAITEGNQYHYGGESI